MTHTSHSPLKENDDTDHVFEPLLDSSQAAALLQIHPKTLQRLARRGEVTGVRVGKLWRFRASQLNQWLEKMTGRGSRWLLEMNPNSERS